MKECTELRAERLSSICPHCGYEEEWFCDPRGQESECERCGEHYIVHSDADIAYW